MKRFTETDKWKDKWFRALSGEHKLAYLYVLDNCDHAGVVDLDEELAEFQIGMSIDWTAFLVACSGRVMVLESGKLWVVKFVEYQYGTISRDCKAHNPVFASIEKHRLKIPFGDFAKGYPKGIQRDQDTYKDKDKDKDKDTDITELMIRSSHMQNPAFAEAWTMWKRKQAAKNGKMDEWTETGQLKELERFSTAEAIEIVQFSTSRTNCVNLITNGDHRKASEAKGGGGGKGKNLLSNLGLR